MIRILCLFLLFATQAPAQEAEPPMTLSRMAEIVFALDEDALNQGPMFQMTIDGVEVIIVTDPSADRMRAMTPIRPIDGLQPSELARMMQANFDTALDARYAIAQDTLWGVFIHPLAPLKKNQLISGIGQTVNLAKTYGTFYTGGAFTYGGGDSDGLHRQLIDDLLQKADPI